MILIETEEIPVSLEIGRTYRFRGVHRGNDPVTGRPLWIYPPSRYRLVGVAPYYRTGQVLVMYVGVGGDHDQDKYHLAPLCDWAEQFTLEERTSKSC